MIYLLLVAILLYSHTMNPGCQRAAVDVRIPFDSPQKVSLGVSETPNERDICAPDTVPRNNNFLVELVGAEEDVHLVDDRRARRRRNRRGGDVHISSHKDNLVRCALATDRQREEVVRCRAEVSDAGHSLFRERPQVRDAVGSLGLLGHLRVERAQEGQVEAPVGGERLRDLSKEARDEGGCARRAHRLEAHAEDIEVPDGVDSEVGWDLYMYVCTRAS